MEPDQRITATVRRLHAYVPGEQPPQGSLINLNTNENPYPPSPAVESALRSLNIDRLRRYPPPDNAPLRRRIAELHGCAFNQTFAGNGSDEVLALCTRAFVEPQASIGYFTPSYSLYPVLTDIQNVRHQPIPLGEDFSWRTPPSSDGCSLFFIAQPNAPTGLCFPKQAIDAFCRTFSGVVLIDEAYADFAEAHCMDLALRYENVLVSRTLSKSYSLAGLRVGYCVGAPALIEALSKVKDSYNLDAVAQVLALAALNDTATMQQQVEKIIAQRERLSSALQKTGFHVYPSQTNFVWTRPPVGLPANVCFERLRERGILVRYFPEGLLGDHVRITIGTPDEMTALIIALDEMTTTGVSIQPLCH